MENGLQTKGMCFPAFQLPTMSRTDFTTRSQLTARLFVQVAVSSTPTILMLSERRR